MASHVHGKAGQPVFPIIAEGRLLQRQVAQSPALHPHRPDIPRIVHDVLRSPGQPVDAITRAFFEPRFGHDFSHVRIHTDERAGESARAVNALAYTVGQDVVFGRNQYVPGSSAGQKLLAHELAHTLQQRERAGPTEGRQLKLGPATGPLENEAEAAANAAMECKASPAIQSAPLAIARQPAPAADPFANEAPALRRRRLDVIRASQNAIARVREGLSKGQIWPFEDVKGDMVHVRNTTARDPTGESRAIDQTIAARDARLRQFMVDLAMMNSELQSAPIPPSWLLPLIEFEDRPMKATGGADFATWTDTLMFYGHRGNAQGLSSTLVLTNWAYIETTPLPTPAVKRAPASPGTETLILIHVPDPKNAPHVYRRLTGYEGWQKGGVVITVWQDDIGYYYNRQAGRFYLPQRP